MKITVCIGSSCHLKGSRHVVEELKSLVRAENLEDSIEFAGCFCMGNCQNGVCVKIDEEPFSLNKENTREFFQREVLPRLGRDRV